MSFYRSRAFHLAYGQLIKIRFLVPQGTLHFAHTATRSILEDVVNSLEMVGCKFISISVSIYHIHRDARKYTLNTQYVLINERQKLTTYQNRNASLIPRVHDSK